MKLVYAALLTLGAGLLAVQLAWPWGHRFAVGFGAMGVLTAIQRRKSDPAKVRMMLAIGGAALIAGAVGFTLEATGAWAPR